ncbi:MAG: MCE family protein [Frankiaceae bacterium]|nr:MCE family protein [Frankiaceae bacterium]MBV9871877.1 MCE family protein [Frankiaceae bacterium]
MIGRRLRVAAMTAGAVVTLGGCGGFGGIYSLPLPGAAGTGSDTYTITADFTDVLDLVPYSAVKVNGATMGHVTKIDVTNGHAVVTCQISNRAKLPENSTAQIEETSLLGEKFVELEPPTAGIPTGTLSDGDNIGLPQTSRDATVEEVLGALSTLLNGGGVEQVNTIAHELNTALDGRTGVSRDLLHQLDVFAAGLDAQKAQIIRAIQGVDDLAKTVRAQENTLTSTVEHVPTALRVLTQDRKDLTTMLVSVKHLGHVAVNVENASQRDLLANLANLRPTLDKLSRVGKVIPKTLEILITYPTADSVENEYAGDYGNLSLTLDLSAKSLVNLLEGSQLPASGTSSQKNRKSAPPSTSVLTQLLKQVLQ